MGIMNGIVGKRCVVAGQSEPASVIVDRFRKEEAEVIALDLAPAQLTDESVVKQHINHAAAQLKGLDIVVTAFVTRDDRPFIEIDDQLWMQTLNENLKCPFLVGREAARIMALGGGGVIVHVGSNLANGNQPGTGAYAAAKAGVHLLTTGSALDLIPHNVRICCVAANELDGGKDSLHDLAGAVTFCASDDASYVVGSTFSLDSNSRVRSL